jgi:aspartyl protease family protein
MAFSSGSKGLVQLAASWVTMAAISVFCVTHFDEIRTALGLKLEPSDLGVVAEDKGRAPPERAAVAVARASGDGAVVIQAGRNGHYETRAQVNGRSIDVLVDTGATTVALTYEDAASAGVFPSDADFRHKVSTANGTARVAAVTLDSVAIEGITVRNVRAVVAEPGRLGTTLLGMSFLGQLRLAEMSRGILTLEQ